MACKSSVSSPYTTRGKTQRRIGEEIYKESETLPFGVLPTKKDIIQCMLFFLRPENSGKTQRTTEDACYIVASSLIENWLYSNIYTKGIKHVKKQIFELYKKFKCFLMYSKQKFYQKPEKNFFFIVLILTWQSVLTFTVKIITEEKILKSCIK